MAEYIEREAAIEAIMYEQPDAHYPQWYADKIKAITSADVSPVRHGRWVEKEKYTFGIMCDCSVCENRILDTGHTWNYCPRCGAKMDLEVKNAEE